MRGPLLILFVGGIVGCALLIVLLIDIVSRVTIKKKVSLFLDSYKSLYIGMSKQQVVDILGNDYTRNANTDTETICWSCSTNNAFQRELYSKKEANKVITVRISENKVVSFSMQ